jgi:hypothetical protein
MAKSEEFIKALEVYAQRYIDVCINHTKEVATGSGKIVELKERHIPTIAYFLNIWLPRNLGETITRETYYQWLKNEQDTVKADTIKKIDDEFKSLAGDIVANEQKGIFYAKNKLGWTDRVDSKTEHSGSLNTTVTVIKSDAPIATSEKDIKLD